MDLKTKHRLYSFHIYLLHYQFLAKVQIAVLLRMFCVCYVAMPVIANNQPVFKHFR